MATKILWRGDNLRFSVVRRTCLQFGAVSNAKIDQANDECWLSFANADDARKCAEAMPWHKLDEVEGVYKCEFKEIKPIDTFSGKKARSRSRSRSPVEKGHSRRRDFALPPLERDRGSDSGRRGFGGGGDKLCWDFQKGRCNRGDSCKFKHGDGRDDRDDRDNRRERHRSRDRRDDSRDRRDRRDDNRREDSRERRDRRDDSRDRRDDSRDRRDDSRDRRDRRGDSRDRREDSRDRRGDSRDRRDRRDEDRDDRWEDRDHRRDD